MRKRDIDAFIEEMEEIGDIWTPEQVQDVYGDYTLDKAIKHRKSCLGQFFDIIGKVINNE